MDALLKDAFLKYVFLIYAFLKYAFLKYSQHHLISTGAYFFWRLLRSKNSKKVACRCLFFVCGWRRVFTGAYSRFWFPTRFYWCLFSGLVAYAPATVHKNVCQKIDRCLYRYREWPVLICWTPRRATTSAYIGINSPVLIRWCREYAFLKYAFLKYAVLKYAFLKYAFLKYAFLRLEFAFLKICVP